VSVSTPIEPGDRVRLPADWLDALGLRGVVLLDRTADGILIRPCPPHSWDQIFADKLTTQPGAGGDDCQVTRDDLLF
jgi:hypothetical protein